MPDDDDRTITVTVAATGKDIRVPRCDVEVYPGVVYLPAWLYRHLEPYISPITNPEDQGYGRKNRTFDVVKGPSQSSQPQTPF